MSGTILPIDDEADPRIASYRDVREKDLEGREGLFVAEGEVVLRVLATRGRFPIASLLIDERRVSSLDDVIRELPVGTPVYVVHRAIMETIVGFPIHRGVLALGRRGGSLDGEDADAMVAAAAKRSLTDGRVRVVGLVGLANHDNVGGVFRNAAAFGAACVLIDGATCDPLYRKAIRVSSGCALTVPFARVSSAVSMVELLTRHGFRVLATAPRGASVLGDIDVPERAAVLLGAEGPGLPDEILARPDVTPLRIAIEPEVDSLNVAVTGALVLHALRCASK